MASLGLHIRTESHLPLVDCVVDDVLRQTLPTVDETLSQLTDVANRSLVHTLLHPAPNSVLCVRVRRLCVPNIMSLGVCFKKLNLIKVGAFAWCSVKIHVFSVCSLRDDNVKTSKPTWKLKHTNSIVEYSEYFCQISSKSLLVILSYTVLKLRRFFETQCRSRDLSVGVCLY